jgi:hypothetical protein
MKRIRGGDEHVGLSALPAVATLLDRELTLSDEESAAARAMYVRHLRTLHWLDAEWTARNLDRIFSEDALGRAAWQTYLR